MIDSQTDLWCDGLSVPRLDRSLRVLVTGVDGVVGGNIALWLARRAEVLGLCRNRPALLGDCQVDRWDPLRTSTIGRLVRGFRPNWIVHCGPMASSSWDVPGECPSAADEIGVCAALQSAAERHGARLAAVLTDAVFAGPRMFHDEQSPIACEHPFARASRQVERALAKRDVLVVRTHAYGWGTGAEPGFAERAWLALAEGLPCFSDPHRYAAPILATDLAELLWLAYQRRLSGLYHVAGAERASAHRFARELAAVAGLPMPDSPAAEASPALATATCLWETSLDTRRIRQALDRPMPMMREGLARFVAQAADGTRARLQGSRAAGPEAA